MNHAVLPIRVVDRSARVAHAIVREQIAALLAPLYLIGRWRRNAASRREAANQGPIDRVGVHASVTTRS